MLLQWTKAADVWVGLVLNPFLGKSSLGCNRGADWSVGVTVTLIGGRRVVK